MHFLCISISMPKLTVKLSINSNFSSPGLPPFAGAKTGQKKYKVPPFDFVEIFF